MTKKKDTPELRNKAIKDGIPIEKKKEARGFTRKLKLIHKKNR